MQFEYVSVSVRDLDRQLEFYAAAFGVTDVRAQLELPQHRVRTAIVSSPSGLALEFIERDGASTRRARDAMDAAATTGWVHLAIRVTDLPQAVTRAETAGATVVSAPARAERPGTWFAYLRDPEGNLLELVADVPRPTNRGRQSASEQKGPD